MNKDELIYLGAATILDSNPYNFTAARVQSVETLIENFLNWATRLYAEQHKLDSVAPDVVKGVPIEQFLAQRKYVVEFRWNSDGTWDRSTRSGLSGEFDSEADAWKALAEVGAGGHIYRVVVK